MAIIVDANCLSNVFDKTCSEHEEFSPVYDWIISGKGKLVYGGTKYIEELSKLTRILRFINLLKNFKNKVVILDKDLVDAEQKRIEGLIDDPDFDDPHIPAMVIVSQCRLLCSRDARSERFVLNKMLYPRGVKPPKYYKGKQNSKLLTDKNIPTKYKPLTKLNNDEKDALGVSPSKPE